MHVVYRMGRDWNVVLSRDGNLVLSRDWNVVLSRDGNVVLSRDGNVVLSRDGNVVLSRDGNVVLSRDGNVCLVISRNRISIMTYRCHMTVTDRHTHTRQCSHLYHENERHCYQHYSNKTKGSWGYILKFVCKVRPNVRKI